MPNILNDINTIALDAFLESKQRSLCLPGLAVAVVQDDQILYERGLGYAAPERVMTPDTPLIIGSLSKSFTALAIMQLVEAGRVGLDVPIQHYIPWFQLADSEAAAAITTRHLLTHTSGISTYAGRELLGGSGGKTIEQSVRELCTLSCDRMKRKWLRCKHLPCSIDERKKYVLVSRCFFSAKPG